MWPILNRTIGRVCFGGLRFLLRPRRRPGRRRKVTILSSVPRNRAALRIVPSSMCRKRRIFPSTDGQAKLSPSGVGYICLLERAQGDQLLVTIRSQGLRGWTSAGALVPLNHADAFFSQQIAANPRDSFAFLMRGMVRYENDDLDRAFADVNEALRLDPKYVAALVERAYLWQCRESARPGYL